jgi:hypothetical protein
MGNLRKHFKVAWNGGESVDVVTNARDVAEAGELESTGNVATGFAVVYSALKRYDHQVPPTLDEFIDQLDDMSTNGTGESVDPTQPQVSTGEPLP